jgi:hypothetical protein
MPSKPGSVPSFPIFIWKKYASEILSIACMQFRKDLDINSKYQPLVRYWSLAISLGLPVMVYILLDRNVARTITSIICIILLVHSWLMQNRYAQSRLRLLLWTFVLLLPMLGAIWLGLNVIRSNTYEFAGDYARHLGDFRQSLYWYVVETQDRIVWIAKADLLPITSLAIVAFWKYKKTKPASDHAVDSLNLG